MDGTRGQEPVHIQRRLPEVRRAAQRGHWLRAGVAIEFNGLRPEVASLVSLPSTVCHTFSVKKPRPDTLWKFHTTRTHPALAVDAVSGHPAGELCEKPTVNEPPVEQNSTTLSIPKLPVLSFSAVSSSMTVLLPAVAGDRQIMGDGERLVQAVGPGAVEEVIRAGARLGDTRRPRPCPGSHRRHDGRPPGCCDHREPPLPDPVRGH